MAKGGYRGPMGGGMNMNMLKQAQKMQAELAKAQDEIKDMDDMDGVEPERNEGEY